MEAAWAAQEAAKDLGKTSTIIRDLNALRISPANSFGCSAAKYPP